MQPLNNWTDKGLKVAALLDAAGVVIERRNGVLLCSDPVLAHQINDAFDLVADLKVTKRAATKLEARNRILAVYPEWKQANMTARGVELQDLWRVNGAWTTQEQAEADALKEAWAWIKLVRSASDLIEADVEAMSDVADVEAFDPATSNRWP